MGSETIRILLADDHAMFRAGIRSVLEKHARFRVVAEAEDGRATVRLAMELTPDVVLMDVSMPLLNGIEATRQIRAQLPRTRVVALSMHSDRQFVNEIFKAGGSGYLLKNSAAMELPIAIEAAARGEVYLSPKVAEMVVASQLRGEENASGSLDVLTPRERQVLQLLAEGKTNKEVASVLDIAVKTAETHRAQIMDKLGIHTVAGLTKFAVRHGLTSLES